ADHGGQAVTADAVVDAAREIPGVLGHKVDGVGLDRLGALADGGLHVRRDLGVNALEQAAQAIRALHAGAAPAHRSISASMVRYRSRGPASAMNRMFRILPRQRMRSAGSMSARL